MEYARPELAQAHSASKAGENKLLYAVDIISEMGLGKGTQCDGQEYPCSDVY